MRSLFIAILFLSVAFFSAAQDKKNTQSDKTDSTVATDEKKGKDEKEKTQLEKDVEEIKNTLAKEKDTTSKVGVIHLKSTSIDIYEGKTKKIVSAIDSVTFSIESGKLSRRLLYVQTKNGRFYNRSAPINVIRINERGLDTLRNIVPGENTYILLKDVLWYENKGGYVPDDVDNITLNKDNQQHVLTASANLNSLINFSLYTDLTGLLGRRPNGLLNTEVSGRFITNTLNVTNRDITLLSFIEPTIVLSKFDSKYKSIDSLAIKPGMNGEKDTVDRMFLMQTAWLKGSMKFNLATIRLVSNQYFSLNILTRINVVNGDSLYSKEKDILFFDYAPEISYSISRLKNFGMDISLKWLQQRLADKEAFSNKGWESVFNPQIGFYYYPTAKPTNRLYLRFNYFANTNKNANNFYQLQFGWKTGIKF